MDIRGGGGHEGDMRSPGSLSYGHLSSRPERKRELLINEASILSEHLQRQASVEPSPDPKAKAAVRYRECLKNHAANIGGNVVDGCGEFMARGGEGTLEALKCAACECHRNFHRKEVEGETQFSSSAAARRVMPLPLPSPTGHHVFSAGMVTPMSVAYCGGTESSSEDLNNNAYVAAPPCSYSVVKKRSRTKFTAEQKQRMLEFADKVGWRFQRQDEEEIDTFCGEVGVKRQVFKVWMHNNKNAIKKPDHDHHHSTPTPQDNHHHHHNAPPFTTTTTTTTTLM